ncbi:MAG: hypothetical protein ABI673_00820 [Novosphingobium sp.]
MPVSVEKLVRLGIDSVALGLDSWAVIGLRTMKIAEGGDAGAAEATLMVAEKIESAALLQWKLMTGCMGTSPLTVSRSTVRHLSGKVRANRHRLAKARK